MNRLKLNNKGMTLIELLIVLAIMGIILQVVYSVFFLGNKSFTISKNKGFSQQDARLVTEIVTKELRNAKKIDIDESKFNEDYYTLEFEEENNRLIRRDKDKNKAPTVIAEGSIEEILFNYSEEIDGIIKVTITTREKDEKYKLDFDILLENIPGYDKEPIGNILNSKIIYYIKYD